MESVHHTVLSMNNNHTRRTYHPSNMTPPYPNAEENAGGDGEAHTEQGHTELGFLLTHTPGLGLGVHTDTHTHMCVREG